MDSLHAGWELKIKEILKIRAGINQGRYWTAGLGINVAGVIMEFATYGENITHDRSKRIDDRKYVGRYELQFN